MRKRTRKCRSVYGSQNVQREVRHDTDLEDERLDIPSGMLLSSLHSLQDPQHLPQTIITLTTGKFELPKYVEGLKNDADEQFLE